MEKSLRKSEIHRMSEPNGANLMIPDSPRRKKRKNTLDTSLQQHHKQGSGSQGERTGGNSWTQVQSSQSTLEGGGTLFGNQITLKSGQDSSVNNTSASPQPLLMKRTTRFGRMKTRFIGDRGDAMRGGGSGDRMKSKNTIVLEDMDSKNEINLKERQKRDRENKIAEAFSNLEEIIRRDWEVLIDMKNRSAHLKTTTQSIQNIHMKVLLRNFDEFSEYENVFNGSRKYMLNTADSNNRICELIGDLFKRVTFEKMEDQGFKDAENLADDKQKQNSEIVEPNQIIFNLELQQILDDRIGNEEQIAFKEVPLQQQATSLEATKNYNSNQLFEHTEHISQLRESQKLMNQLMITVVKRIFKVLYAMISGEMNIVQCCLVEVNGFNESTDFNDVRNFHKECHNELVRLANQIQIDRFILFLALNQPECIDQLCRKKKERQSDKSQEMSFLMRFCTKMLKRIRKLVFAFNFLLIHNQLSMLSEVASHIKIFLTDICDLLIAKLSQFETEVHNLQEKIKKEREREEQEFQEMEEARKDQKGGEDSNASLVQEMIMNKFRRTVQDQDELAHMKSSSRENTVRNLKARPSFLIGAGQFNAQKSARAPDSDLMQVISQQNTRTGPLGGRLSLLLGQQMSSKRGSIVDQKQQVHMQSNYEIDQTEKVLKVIGKALNIVKTLYGMVDGMDVIDFTMLNSGSNEDQGGALVGVGATQASHMNNLVNRSFGRNQQNRRKDDGELDENGGRGELGEGSMANGKNMLNNLDEMVGEENQSSLTLSAMERQKKKRFISPQADMIEVLTFFEKALDKNDWAKGLTKTPLVRKEKLDISEGYSSEFDQQESSSKTDISSLQKETFGVNLLQTQLQNNRPMAIIQEVDAQLSFEEQTDTNRPHIFDLFEDPFRFHPTFDGQMTQKDTLKETQNDINMLQIGEKANSQQNRNANGSQESNQEDSSFFNRQTSAPPGLGGQQFLGYIDDVAKIKRSPAVTFGKGMKKPGQEQTGQNGQNNNQHRINNNTANQGQGEAINQLNGQKMRVDFSQVNNQVIIHDQSSQITMSPNVISDSEQPIGEAQQSPTKKVTSNPQIISDKRIVLSQQQVIPKDKQIELDVMKRNKNQVEILTNLLVSAHNPFQADPISLMQDLSYKQRTDARNRHDFVVSGSLSYIFHGKHLNFREMTTNFDHTILSSQIRNPLKFGPEEIKASQKGPNFQIKNEDGDSEQTRQTLSSRAPNKFQLKQMHQNLGYAMTMQSRFLDTSLKVNELEMKETMFDEQIKKLVEKQIKEANSEYSDSQSGLTPPKPPNINVRDQSKDNNDELEEGDPTSADNTLSQGSYSQQNFGMQAKMTRKRLKLKEERIAKLLQIDIHDFRYYKASQQFEEKPLSTFSKSVSQIENEQALGILLRQQRIEGELRQDLFENTQNRFEGPDPNSSSVNIAMKTERAMIKKFQKKVDQDYARQLRFRDELVGGMTSLEQAEDSRFQDLDNFIIGVDEQELESDRKKYSEMMSSQRRGAVLQSVQSDQIVDEIQVQKLNQLGQQKANFAKKETLSILDHVWNDINPYKSKSRMQQAKQLVNQSSNSRQMAQDELLNSSSINQLVVNETIQNNRNNQSLLQQSLAVSNQNEYQLQESLGDNSLQKQLLMGGINSQQTLNYSNEQLPSGNYYGNMNQNSSTNINTINKEQIQISDLHQKNRSLDSSLGNFMPVKQDDIRLENATNPEFSLMDHSGTVIQKQEDSQFGGGIYDQPRNFLLEYDQNNQTGAYKGVDQRTFEQRSGGAVEARESNFSKVRDNNNNNSGILHQTLDDSAEQQFMDLRMAIRGVANVSPEDKNPYAD